MVHALILVRASGPAQDKFIAAAKRVGGVVDAFPVFGRFDVALLLEAKTHDELRRLAQQIIGIGGVRSTETMLEPG